MRHLICRFILVVSLPALCFADNGRGDFEQVRPGRTLFYPRDHGAHPGYKTEWWYFTGHLTPVGEGTARFGFELVFFRAGLSRQPSKSRSKWKSDTLFFAHFAVTDDKHREFFKDEQSKRGSFGDAGASTETLDVWNGQWKARLEDGVIRLQAASADYELQLELRPVKPIVLHGDRGFSRKGEGDGDASYYSSFTRLRGRGRLRTPRESLTIADASAWMDQEFTSSEAGEAKIGWDWFALQLDDGREVMLYQLRDKDDMPTGFSAGTIVEADGSSQGLGPDDFRIKVERTWKSGKTGITYPAQWTLDVLPLGRSFRIEPTLADQELTTSGSTGVSYWEGRCLVKEQGAAAGNAYVELVGYRAK